MARIIDTDVKHHLAFTIQTVFEDGSTSDKELHIDDMLSGLRYVENEEIKIIPNGRLSNIEYRHISVSRSYNSAEKMKSYFKEDVTPISIDVDCSTEYHSNVITVPVMEIVEDAGVTEVARMKCFLSYAAEFTIKLSDDTVNNFVIHEGDNLVGLTYLEKGGDETADAKIVAFKFDKDLNPTKLECIINGRAKELDILQIKEIGAVVKDATPDKPMSEIIASAPEGKIYLTEGEFSGDIEALQDISITGANANTVAYRRDFKNLTGETVLTDKITVGSGTKIKLTGLTITGNALLKLNNASEVELKNCIITDLKSDGVGEGYGLLFGGNTKTKLTVKGCYFGNYNTDEAGKKIYNLLEINSALEDGSEISDNYFADKASTNNSICVYDVTNNAIITIANNIWEKSANGIRIGVKGEPTCTFNIIDNTYYSTETNIPEYAGLLLIQPYGEVTTSMANMTVNISGTTHSDDLQVWYKYDEGTSMKFTEYTIPTVIVDGETVLGPAIKA